MGVLASIILFVAYIVMALPYIVAGVLLFACFKVGWILLKAILTAEW